MFFLFLFTLCELSSWYVNCLVLHC